MKKRNWILVADLILTFILERRKLKAQEKLDEKQSADKDTDVEGGIVMCQS